MRGARRPDAPPIGAAVVVAVLAQSLGVACVPERSAALPSGTSFLVFTMHPAVGGPVVEAHAYDAPLRRRLVWAEALEGLTIAILAYDRPLADLSVEVGPDHRVLFPPPDARPADTWSVPVAAQWVAYDPDDAEPRRGSGLPPELEAVRLHRAACPQVRYEPTLPEGQTVSTLWPMGDRALLIGRSGTRIPVAPPDIWWVEHGQPPRLLPPPEVISSTSTFGLPPRLYDDDGQLRTLWGGNVPERTWSYAVTSTGGFFDRRPVRVAPDTALRATHVVGLEGGGFVTVNERWMPEQRRNAVQLAVQRPGAEVLDVRYESQRDGSDCQLGTFTHVLTMLDAWRGVASLPLEPIRLFDLRRDPVWVENYGPSEGRPICRSARATNALGDEVLTWAGPPLVRPDRGVAWRPAGSDAWTVLEGDGAPDGMAAFAREDDFLVTVDGDAVALYQRDQRRPDVPPRYCGDFAVGMSVTKVLARDDDIFVGGSEGLTAWLTIDP